MSINMKTFLKLVSQRKKHLSSVHTIYLAGTTKYITAVADMHSDSWRDMQVSMIGNHFTWN